MLSFTISAAVSAPSLQNVLACQRPTGYILTFSAPAHWHGQRVAHKSMFSGEGFHKSIFVFFLIWYNIATAVFGKGCILSGFICLTYIVLLPASTNVLVFASSGKWILRSFCHWAMVFHLCLQFPGSFNKQRQWAQIITFTESSTAVCSDYIQKKYFAIMES